MAISINEFLELRAHLPVIDVRSQGEFASGHIRHGINIPILNDEERIAVGTDYKQRGQQEAIRTGFRIVGPRLHEIISSAEQVAAGKELLVHCWRGGMRSGNFCQFVGMAGVKTHSLEGGYKSYRQFALESFRRPLHLILLTGYTGSGKTEILRALKNLGEQVLDLEKLAHHKGSAFGGLLMPPQPTSEQFQNELFEELRMMNSSKRIWVEDESIAIGRIFLPTDFWTQMNGRPLIQMEVAKEIRTQRLVEEYGDSNRQEFLDTMTKIVKKLGGQHYKQAVEVLALGDMAATIDILLTYYDKAYLKSIDKRKSDVKHIISWDGNHVDEFAKKLATQFI